jgi:Rap1a immunity proteins
MKKLLLLTTAVLSTSLVGNPAEACLVKDPSGNLSVRSSPNGQIVGALKNGTLVVIEERRGDWVSITPHAKRSDAPVWVRLAQLDCDFVDDEYRKAEQQGKTPEQFANEILRDIKPVRRSDQQLRAAASTAAGTVALKEWCKVPLTYGEQVEFIVISTTVGSGRLAEALNKLDESRKEIGASEFCLRLEKGIRGKVENPPSVPFEAPAPSGVTGEVPASGVTGEVPAPSGVTGEVLALACLSNVPGMKREKNTEDRAKFCNSYITGWDDARFAFLQGTTTYCPPKRTVKAISVIFVDYLATHKEARKLPAAEALMLAFKDKWPCH